MTQRIFSMATDYSCLVGHIMRKQLQIHGMHEEYFFWEVVIFELNTLNKGSLRPYHLEYWSLCLEQCQLLGSVFKPSL